MAQFISVEEVIQNLLIEEGKSSEHEYLRYFNIAMSGLKELNFDTVRQVKTIELTIDHKNTVSLPSDYVSYLQIATVGDRGDLNYLGHRERINLVHGSKSTNVEDKTEHPVFTDNTPGDGLFGRYGQGGGTNSNGYYRENLEEETIEFSDVTGNVVIEYISDGSSDLEGDQIKIHSFAEEALKSYIYFKSIYRKRAINMNEKMVAKKEYYNQKRLARARMQSFNKQEALQTTRKAFKQAPKL
jgi:hypothetical protein|tara:strand:- start:2278 stop:3003 length:726 start_codon:yes stop_codon:yes gene_type:complete